MKKWACFGIVMLLFVVVIPALASATGRDYKDATIELKATGFLCYGINGTHSSHKGYGHDNTIVLWGEYFGFYPVNNIYENGKRLDQRSGWHTKVTITGFDGWMSGQFHTTIFGKNPLKLIGHCDLINITVYRG